MPDMIVNSNNVSTHNSHNNNNNKNAKPSPKAKGKSNASKQQAYRRKKKNKIEALQNEVKLLREENSELKNTNIQFEAQLNFAKQILCAKNTQPTIVKSDYPAFGGIGPVVPDVPGKLSRSRSRDRCSRSRSRHSDPRYEKTNRQHSQRDTRQDQQDDQPNLNNDNHFDLTGDEINPKRVVSYY